MQKSVIVLALVGVSAMATIWLQLELLEYGIVVYMGAADSHLDKLDRIQRSGEKIGEFTVEPLKCRREATSYWSAEGEADCKITHLNLLTSRQSDFRDTRAMD